MTDRVETLSQEDSHTRQDWTAKTEEASRDQDRDAPLNPAPRLPAYVMHT